MKLIHVLFLMAAILQQAHPQSPQSSQPQNLTKPTQPLNQLPSSPPLPSLPQSPQPPKSPQSEIPQPNHRTPRYRTRARRYNNFQFPVRYEIFMLYALIVCGVMLVCYAGFRCLKRYRKSKLQQHIAQKYIKHITHQQQQQQQQVPHQIILPTFHPNPQQQEYHPQFYSFPYENKISQPMQTPYFSKGI